MRGGKRVPELVWRLALHLARREVVGDESEVVGDESSLLAGDVHYHVKSVEEVIKPRTAERRSIVHRGAVDPRIVREAAKDAEAADADPWVQWWRDIYLDGNKLKPNQMRRFIATNQADKARLRQVTVWAPAEGGPDYIKTQAGPPMVQVQGYEDLINDRPLFYADAAGRVQRAEIRGAALAHLASLVDHLTEKYGWDEPATTRFVLTGIRPPAWAQTGSRVGNRIEMSVRTHTPAEEVRASYASLRKHDPITAKQRRVKQKTVDLEAFVRDHPDLSWAQTMEAWNKEHPDPDDKYRDRRWFRESAARAWKRVNGEKMPRRR